MRGASDLFRKQDLIQKFTELFRRTVPTILKILHDWFSSKEEISMTGFTLRLDTMRLNVSNFHIHH
jgi:hypothetical protein